MIKIAVSVIHLAKVNQTKLSVLVLINGFVKRVRTRRATCCYNGYCKYALLSRLSFRRCFVNIFNFEVIGGRNKTRCRRLECR